MMGHSSPCVVGRCATAVHALMVEVAELGSGRVCLVGDAKCGGLLQWIFSRWCGRAQCMLLESGVVTAETTRRQATMEGEAGLDGEGPASA
jgi:hypothetical protein